MKFKLAAGAEVDILTARELDESLAKMRKALIEDQRSWRENVVRNPSNSGVVAADGTLTLDLGAPAQRRRWNVRRVNVSGVAPTTPAAGTATIYRKIADATHYVDQTPAIPAVGPWEPDQFPLKHDETLLVVFTGAVSGTTLIASATVVDTSDLSTLVVD